MNMPGPLSTAHVRRDAVLGTHVQREKMKSMPIFNIPPDGSAFTAWNTTLGLGSTAGGGAASVAGLGSDSRLDPPWLEYDPVPVLMP